MDRDYLRIIIVDVREAFLRRGWYDTWRSRDCRCVKDGRNGDTAVRLDSLLYKTHFRIRLIATTAAVSVNLDEQFLFGIDRFFLSCNRKYTEKHGYLNDELFMANNESY